MLSSAESDDEFFDSFNCFSPEDVINEVGIGLWRNELMSVRERREIFFQKMGFDELGELSKYSTAVGSIEMEAERITRECYGASSSSYVVSISGIDTLETAADNGREENGHANTMIDEFEIEQSSEGANNNLLKVSSEAEVVHRKFDMDSGKVINWWRRITTKRRVVRSLLSTAKRANKIAKPTVNRSKVQVNKKRIKELSALYMGQEFQAHYGVIWTAKFSPDGQFLATGGQDKVVRIWRITSAPSSFSSSRENFHIARKEGRSGFRKKKGSNIRVVIPHMVFHIEESPVQEFHGHSSDVLDLAWSRSNCLLSSSADNTVRLWQVASGECVNVFHHSDFVSCVQFNPIDDSYFISGSIDGVIRLWGVSEGRVVDWDYTRDSVTALSYQPDGQGFVVGSFDGGCRFYTASGNSLQLTSHIKIQGSKRTTGNRITGIQFLREDYKKVMITSEDSKVRVVDRTSNVVRKYRGFSKSGCQKSASFTPNQRHIISVGEDSHVYMWNYNNDDEDGDLLSSSLSNSRHTTKSVRSCEYFHSPSVSVVLPWSLSDTSDDRLSWCSCSSRTQESIPESVISSSTHDESSLLVSLSSCLASREGSLRVAPAYPEETLSSNECCCGWAYSRTSNLMIVTGSLDGTIRAFYNYGLPISS